MIALLLILGVAALGVAAWLGLTPDTRDPAYGIGGLVDSRITPQADRPS
jgi:hypothetical protein